MKAPLFDSLFDEVLRDDPALRSASASLVAAFGKLLQAHADQLVQEAGSRSASLIDGDNAAAHLLWQFAEFLFAGPIDRDEEGGEDWWSLMRMPEQYVPRCAADRFSCEITPAGKFIPLLPVSPDCISE